MEYKEFTYEKNNNEITLTSYNGQDTKVTIPSFIEGCPITSITPHCFIQCDELSFVPHYHIEEFIVNNDNQAFSSFEGALYNKGMTTLYRYPNIEQITVTLPDTLMNIQTCAFAYCSHIKEICIPQKVENIQKLAFLKSNQLGNIIVDPHNPYYTSIDGILYDKEVKDLIVCPPGYWTTHIKVPQTVQTIEPYAFHYCNLIRHVELPDHLECIQDYTFSGCNNLYRIHMPEKLKVISKHAFSSCAFQKLELPDNLRVIDDYAFEKCHKLQTITIPQNVISIGENIFSCHYRLLLLNVHENSKALDYARENDYQYQIIEEIHQDDFLYEIENKSITLMRYIGNSQYIDIPAMLQGFPVTHIDADCFDKCNVLSYRVNLDNISLISIDGVIFSKDKIHLIAYPNAKEDLTYQIPDGVKIIDSKAFNRCLYLESIEMPESITTIETLAFDESPLTHIKLTKNIQTIKPGAFTLCHQLESYDVDNRNPYYASKDEVLYTRNFDTLIAYPSAKESHYFKIPDGVTCIQENAFSYCYKTSRIFIPLSVIYIGQDAFALCYNLKGIDVDVNNQYFKSDNGHLYDNQNNLIVIPSIDDRGSMHLKQNK